MRINRMLYCSLLALALLVQRVDAQTLAPAVNADYVIREGNLLKIRIWPDATLSGDFLVEPSGKVQLPMLGELHAAGITLPEFQADVRARYARITTQPVVSVTPIFSVAVFGGVHGPGLQRVDATATVADVISAAGGFSERAKPAEMYIVRNATRIPVNADEFVAGGASLLQLKLQSGDRIIVPQRRGLSVMSLLYGFQLAASLVVLYNQLTQ